MTDSIRHNKPFVCGLQWQVGVVLRNGMLFERISRARDQKSELVHVARLVSIEYRLPELIQYISSVGRTIIGCRIMILHIFDSERDCLW